MDNKLIFSLNFSFETVMMGGHYGDAFETGLFLLKKGWLTENNLKLLMVCAIKNNTRKILLSSLLNIEEQRELKPLEKGLVSSLFYQLKDYKRCSEYGLLYSRERSISIDKKAGKLSVLILQTFSSGAFNFNSKTRSFHMPEGHNNLMSLLDQHVKKIILRVDDLDVALKKLEKKNIHFDVIYNSITDPDRCKPALSNAIALCRAFPDIPVVNHPENVLASARDNNYYRFHSMPHIMYPKNIKLENISGDCHLQISEAIKKHQLAFPIIVRLSGYQGGKNMHLIDSIDDHNFTDFDTLVNQEPKDIYLIEYVDVSFSDKRVPNTKLYPKYRAFWAGGKLYPIHLFVSDNNFNVHLSNSESFMNANPWLIDMEREFCKVPEEVIGKNSWEALGSLMKKTGLDYAGIDFAVNKKGIVVFEINAAMRNWMKNDRAPLHVRESWKDVTQSIHEFLCSISNKLVWEFHLPTDSK